MRGDHADCTLTHILCFYGTVSLQVCTIVRRKQQKHVITCHDVISQQVLTSKQDKRRAFVIADYYERWPCRLYVYTYPMFL